MDLNVPADFETISTGLRCYVGWVGSHPHQAGRIVSFGNLSAASSAASLEIIEGWHITDSSSSARKLCQGIYRLGSGRV